MGGFLDKPETEKYNEHGSGNGLFYGLASMQGWRTEMEDAHCAVIGLPQNLQDWSFFAVFDGHAGAGVSSLCAENLLESITQCEDFNASAENGAAGRDNAVTASSSMDKIKHSIREGFLQLDEKMRSMPQVLSGNDKSGSTAVCCLASPTHLFIANCGDSRAVFSRSSKVFLGTQDHKPIMPAEKERIQNAGGSVMIERVNGSLAVSRALGDYEYKQVEGKGQCEQLVSPEPEVIIQERDIENDEFLILACDGVWDVMSNDQLCDFVRSRLRITSNLEEICNDVIDTCFYKGSKDNISIVLVIFPGGPCVTQEEIKKERQLENGIYLKIRDIMTADSSIRLKNLISILDDLEFKNLPPGGGLQSKHKFIESTFNKLKPPDVELDTKTK